MPALGPTQPTTDVRLTKVFASVLDWSEGSAAGTRRQSGRSSWGCRAVVLAAVAAAGVAVLAAADLAAAVAAARADAPTRPLGSGLNLSDNEDLSTPIGTLTSQDFDRSTQLADGV